VYLHNIIGLLSLNLLATVAVFTKYFFK